MGRRAKQHPITRHPSGKFDRNLLYQSKSNNSDSSSEHRVSLDPDVASDSDSSSSMWIDIEEDKLGIESRNGWATMTLPKTWDERAADRKAVKKAACDAKRQERHHREVTCQAELVFDGAVDKAGGAKDKTGEKRGTYGIGGDSERTAQRKRKAVKDAADAAGKDADSDEVRKQLQTIKACSHPTENAKLTSFFDVRPSKKPRVGSEFDGIEVIGLAQAERAHDRTMPRHEDGAEDEMESEEGGSEVDEGLVQDAEWADREVMAEMDDRAIGNVSRERGIDLDTEDTMDVDSDKATSGDTGPSDAMSMQTTAIPLGYHRHTDDGSDVTAALAGTNHLDIAIADADDDECDTSTAGMNNGIAVAGVKNSAMVGNVDGTDNGANAMACAGNRCDRNGGASEWVDDILDEAAPKSFLELEALARNGLKGARKTHHYCDEVLYASLVDFYCWTPRQGRGKASAQIARNLGCGRITSKLSGEENSPRKFSPQRDHDDGLASLALNITCRKGKHCPGQCKESTHRVTAEQVTPHLLQRHMNESLLPSLALSKTCVGQTWAHHHLLTFGYRRKKHSKGTYYDGHEQKSMRERRTAYLMEFKDIQRYNGIVMDETLPTLIDNEIERVWIFQDESAFHVNDFQNVDYWLKAGEQVLKKKGRGQLMMVSGYICERFGNIALPEVMVEENAKLPENLCLKITDSHAIIFPSLKDGSDSYWNSEQMMAQATSQRTQYCPPSFSELCPTLDMNVKPGGQQPHMHDTIIPLDNAFGYAGQQQSFDFPSHLPEGHPDKSFEGKPKGMKQVLLERGYTSQSLGFKGKKKLIGECAACKGRKARKVQSADDEAGTRAEDDYVDSEESEEDEEDDAPTTCCMRRILSLQDDFLKQKSLLEIVIEKENDVCHFLPKFHPEINPIEYYWGWVKRYYRERTNGNFQHAKKLLNESLEACLLITMRCFFRRVQRYMSVYDLGATGIAAEYAVKKYASHRGVSQKDLDTAHIL
ncbi:hypothetical protein EVG20_g9466 [Dentipellis fragilis]|uniref:Uncharacterized protein n=1 Tax=Dentipellis fragilis TaxID=205917 RepID=A0A4Y9XXZ1_9AGAM|nr:hypothetical protein EVG20_g9466 [Dentipellis fragilis]